MSRGAFVTGVVLPSDEFWLSFVSARFEAVASVKERPVRWL
jgi:hypothetical protein